MSDFHFNSEEKNADSSRKLTTTGKILLGLTGGIGLGLTVVCASFVAPALRRHCLPYVPATPAQVANIFNGLKNRKGNLLDIGSGDGRIVIAAVQNGFKADGVELNPWLVYYSRLNALGNGTYGKTKFFCKDLWKFSLTPYENIVIFGVEQMMTDLESKLLAEVKSNVTVAACRFPLPTVTPVNTIGSGVDTVWIYKIAPSMKT